MLITAKDVERAYVRLAARQAPAYSDTDAAAAADRQPYGGLLAILCSSLNLCRWAYCSPAWALVPLPIVLFFR